MQQRNCYSRRGKRDILVVYIERNSPQEMIEKITSKKASRQIHLNENEGDIQLNENGRKLNLVEMNERNLVLANAVKFTSSAMYD